MDKFYRLMYTYFRDERARSEACLGDIVNIIGDDTGEGAQVEKITERLIQHYERIK